MNYTFYHNSHDSFYRFPFGAVECGQKITLRISMDRTFKAVRAVYLRLWKNSSVEEKVPMHSMDGCGGLTVYECEITAPCDVGLLWYFFIIECDDRLLYYGNNTGSMGGVGSIYEYEPPSFQVTVYKKGFKTPSWLKDSIMYQIFVDRFCKSSNYKPADSQKGNWVMHDDWYEMPNYKPDPETGEYICNDCFGGNLQGVIEKLPYLKELGIDVIYLNPIFEAQSNHKYNTGNYMKIDSMYGDEFIFRNLVSEAGRLGISIILDGVFSHTGSDSVYFNKNSRYPSIGAYQSEASPYFKWYKFTRHPEDYECWWGIKTLPNVNELEPSYLDFILGECGVVRHWMEFRIMGWRLDVADELPDEFIKKLRSVVKGCDGDAVVIGEVWEDASSKTSYGVLKQYLLGDELDSVMNYPLMNAIINFFTEKISAGDLYDIIMSLYENYPLHCFYSLMNILGTHDTCRIKYALAGINCSGSLSREEQALTELSPLQAQLAVRRLKMASLFLMAIPGVPVIYYGDEAGLGGCRDPFNRNTYPWGREDNDLIDWYKKICTLRHNIAALRTGTFTPVYFNEDTFGFIREISGGTDIFGEPKSDGFALVLFNRSSHIPNSIVIDLSKWGINTLSDLLNSNTKLSSSGCCFHITLPPLSPGVWGQFIQKSGLGDSSSNK